MNNQGTKTPGTGFNMKKAIEERYLSPRAPLAPVNQVWALLPGYFVVQFGDPATATEILSVG